jgi:hypothetical protein
LARSALAFLVFESFTARRFSSYFNLSSKLLITSSFFLFHFPVAALKPYSTLGSVKKAKVSPKLLKFKNYQVEKANIKVYTLKFE